MKKSLERRRQVSITVKGRKTGRRVVLPVWFVVDGGSIWLLPVYGSRTQWYRNVQANATITVQAGSVRRRVEASPVTDRRVVRKVIRLFREKYTPEEIKRWYSGLDVAVEAPLERGESQNS